MMNRLLLLLGILSFLWWVCTVFTFAGWSPFVLGLLFFFFPLLLIASGGSLRLRWCASEGFLWPRGVLYIVRSCLGLACVWF